jgi:hypothetical protein
MATLEYAIKQNDLQSFQSQLRRKKRVTLPHEWHVLAMRVFETFGQGSKERTQWFKSLLGKDSDLSEQRRYLVFAIELVGNEEAMRQDKGNRFQNLESVYQGILENSPQLILPHSSENKRSICHEAAQLGAASVIRWLREQARGRREADLQEAVLTQDSNEKSALHLAVEWQSLESVRELLALDRHLLSKSFQCGKNIVHTAIAKGNLKILRELLWDTKTLVDIEMLKTAVKNGCKKILSYLIRHQPALLEAEECTLLHDAVRANSVEIVKMLLQRKPRLAITLEKVKGGSGEMIELPVLREYKRTTQEGLEILGLVLPAIISQLPVSDIRDHISCVSSASIFPSILPHLGTVVY